MSRGEESALTNQSCYSGCEQFASHLKHSSRGLLVGRQTAGAGGLATIPQDGILPNSRLAIQLSVAFGQGAAGEAIENLGIAPHRVWDIKIADLADHQQGAMQEITRVPAIQVRAVSLQPSDLPYCQSHPCPERFRAELEKAEAGDPDAQNLVGEMLHFGHGVPKDFAAALAWYRRASAQGHAVAPNHIGRLYLNAEGVERDEDEACRWYRLSAERGDSDGKLNGMACDAEIKR